MYFLKTIPKKSQKAWPSKLVGLIQKEESNDGKYSPVFLVQSIVQELTQIRRYVSSWLYAYFGTTKRT